MRFFLFILIFNSLLFGSDLDMIYKNGVDIDIKIYNKKTFKVTRYDGLILRDTIGGEKFFIDRSGGKVNIEYKILKKDGGVDIEYRVVNLTNKPQNMPDFVVDGIRFQNSKVLNYLNILNTQNFQYMHKRYFNEKSFIEDGYFDVNGKDFVYPEVYSPVIVAQDEVFSVGSSLIFNYQKDYIEPHFRVYKLKNSLFRYSYCDIQNRDLKPFEELNIVLTLRFSNSKNWLYTLYPYKKHFLKLYNKFRTNEKKDLNPINGILLSYGSAAYENYLECKKHERNCVDDEKNILKYNLYGYNYYIRLDLEGLDRFVDSYIKKLKKSGYKRTMLWAVTGQYWLCPKSKLKENDGFLECTTNYPPQFIIPNVKRVKDTLSSLKRFSQNGISLGVWWGRSGEIPKDFIWNPDDTLPFDIRDKRGVKFALKQLDLAYSYKVKEIGLDAFSNMRIDSQLVWLKYIKDRYPEMKFYSEGGVTDFLHTQTSLFLQPQNMWIANSMSDIKDRAYLAEYLNPNSEIIVYYPIKTPTLDELQRVIDLGYTPLILANPDIYKNDLLDISSLKIK